MKSRTFFNALAGAIAFGWLFASLFAADAQGQRRDRGQPAAAGPKVEKIDEKRFAELLKPNGKPLLINFWATWCEPCREEFPDLVKIDAEYKGKIDFITISLDFEEEIATTVPKFLAEMKAEMPTFLLVTPDETAAIQMVSKDWAGALPFTVIYAPDGKLSYFRQGIVKHDVLQAELDKLIKP
ncbi:MAG: redoxin domain-containing protein [Acidobacteria bacterium]|nr:redoxin domain-containing protein [Acidobacteriota bacterium]